MLCDFYELTMGNGYYRNGFYKRNVYFDVFFRNVPDGGGFAIAAGLEQIVEYIQQLHFSDDDIAYLRGKGIFDEGFLNYLKNFKFHGDIYAVPEGTPAFPGEPLLTVRAPAIEAQLIETYLLLEINHQSLIATKANRIVRAAQGRAVLEFGSRRAQGADGAVIGARAAYIGGVAGTACTLTDVLYGVPAAARWRTRGCRCSRRNTTPSRPTVSCTPTTRRCWLTPTTRSNPACRTLSARSRRFCCRAASPISPSVWIPATFRICPRRRAKCSTRRACRTARLPRRTRWTNTSSAT